jgi:hypothetical protein
MAQTLVPMRELVTTLGYDDDGQARTLFGTVWLLRGTVIDHTGWYNSPVQAIRAAEEADRHYRRVMAA